MRRPRGPDGGMPGRAICEGAMRAVFLTPSLTSSGEARTAGRIASRARRRGWTCRFLASRHTAGYLPSSAGRVDLLGDDRTRNRRLWRRLLEDFGPDVVVFADYPLLFFSSGTAPLADPEWVAGLEAADPELATLDHLGLAQGRRVVYYGPPHLSQRPETVPDPPPSMTVLLPCPLHEPGAVEGRRGRPFRRPGATDGPSREAQRDVRSEFAGGEGERLVLHSVSSWARQFAAAFDLPYLAYLPRLLGGYLSGVPGGVSVVSVNGEESREPVGRDGVRYRAVGALPPDRYQTLLAAADLLLTENMVSATLGRRVVQAGPCAVLRNTITPSQIRARAGGHAREIAAAMESERPGSVFPWDVFPIWSTDDLEELGLFRGNGFTETFAELEVFGGEPTGRRLRQLLVSNEEQASLRRRQRAYVGRVEALPGAIEALEEVVGAEPRTATREVGP